VSTESVFAFLKSSLSLDICVDDIDCPCRDYRMRNCCHESELCLWVPRDSNPR
jgi:hypothetical protein